MSTSTFSHIKPSALDWSHINKCLDLVPEKYHRSLLKAYEVKYQNPDIRIGDKYHSGRYQANTYLLEAKQRAQSINDCNTSPEILADRAQRLADLAVLQLSGLTSPKDQEIVVNHLCASNGIDTPTSKHDDINGKVLRIKNVSWWKRQLFKKGNRAFELLAIHCGLVNKNRDSYVSNYTLTRIMAQRKRALDFMQSLEAVSEDGDVLDMADVLEGSLSNPAVRRAEMMVRIHGTSKYADQQGHVAEWYTITAPSKYHASSRKYINATPRDTHKYLNKVWQRIRAKLSNSKIKIYGLRVAEPHHDATPHWHIMAFMADGNQQKVRDIISHYALLEDGDEYGAKKHRFDYDDSVSTKNAASYLAKYISKNIDGYGMDNDNESGLDAASGAERVRAYASLWGIRQFQFFGTQKVGVWRELRRVRNTVNDGHIEQARVAADNADWCEYTNLQLESMINTVNTTFIDKSTGAFESNQYEELIERITGIESAGYELVTRDKRWMLQTKGLHETQPVESAMSGRFVPWHIENKCTAQTEVRA